MFCKLAFKNVQKSFKDYTIYFLTLMFAVCLFYVFNSIQSQQAMLEISESTQKSLQILTTSISYFSVFVAVVLGFLVVYANNFLVKRRKKEVGIYLMLGMQQNRVSILLMLETLIVGVLALVVGIVIGVFASQAMSVVTATLFEVKLTKYAFTFSADAVGKTVLCFGVIFLIVIVFNFITISRLKLIDLIHGAQKNEKPRFRNGVVSIIAFVAAVVMLVYAYYQAINKGLMNMEPTPVVLGCVGTLLFFFSLSGFLLRVLQHSRRFYYKGLNMFVMRQINSRINTTFVSLSVICLMLFLTICTLSGGIGIANFMSADLNNSTPYSATVIIPNTFVDRYFADPNNASTQKTNIVDTLQQYGFDIHQYAASYAEYNVYTGSVLLTDLILDRAPTNDYTKALKEQAAEVTAQNGGVTPSYLKLSYITQSDYNKIMQMSRQQTISLKDNQFCLLGSATTKKTFDYFLQQNGTLQINGQTLQTANQEVVDTNIATSSSSTDDGFAVIPDSVAKGLPVSSVVLNMQYKSELPTAQVDNALGAVTNDKKVALEGVTRTDMYEASNSIEVTATYLAIYLGFTFLIAGAAVLAIQQLSEASDNVVRYNLLRKLGAEPGMIQGALFKQIAIYFLLPLALAIVHSIVGLTIINQFLHAMHMISTLPYILTTAGIVLVIYGIYFIATYFGCRGMIREKKA